MILKLVTVAAMLLLDSQVNAESTVEKQKRRIDQDAAKSPTLSTMHNLME